MKPKTIKNIGYSLVGISCLSTLILSILIGKVNLFFIIPLLICVEGFFLLYQIRDKKDRWFGNKLVSILTGFFVTVFFGLAGEVIRESKDLITELYEYIITHHEVIGIVGIVIMTICLFFYANKKIAEKISWR